MTIVNVSIAAIALVLVGCTTSPPSRSATLNVQNITDAILTELYCAAIAIPGDDQDFGNRSTSLKKFKSLSRNFILSIIG